MIWLALLLVMGLGFANQRGSTCAVSAADEIIAQRSFHRLAGFLVAGAVSAALLFALGTAPREVAAPGWGALAGGVIGGLGAALNGRCAMGTIASLGRGRIDRVATLAGFFIGAGVVIRGLAVRAQVAVQEPRHSLLLAAIAAVVAGIAWTLARSRDAAAPGWMALIGLLNAVLAWMMMNWSYTGGLTRLARGDATDLIGFLSFLGMLVAGSLFGAWRTGTFQPPRSTLQDWGRSAVGGCLLGAGSAIVPGSNDAMLLVGVPLLVPGLLMAYASFWITLIVVRGLRHVHLIGEQRHAEA